MINKKDLIGPYPMLIFPVLQLLAFSLACNALAEESYIQTLLWTLASALLLSFSLHVCIHEFIHYSAKSNIPSSLPFAFTALSGLPFEGYRVHHMNHHRYNNQLGDISSTWKQTPTGLKAKPLVTYALTWPSQVIAGMRLIRQQAQTGELSLANQRSIKQHKFLMAVLLMSLAIFFPKALLIYLFMIFWGWMFISIHNYGQHPPIKNPQDELTCIVTSVHTGWYNFLFFNNGLHFEHHRQPTVPHRALLPDNQAHQIKNSHLLYPCRLLFSAYLLLFFK